jgi:transposase
VVVSITQQIDELSKERKARFEDHPDAKIIHRLPGLGPVLGARVLGEFGDVVKSVNVRHNLGGNVGNRREW